MTSRMWVLLMTHQIHGDGPGNPQHNYIVAYLHDLNVGKDF